MLQPLGMGVHRGNAQSQLLEIFLDFCSSKFAHRGCECVHIIGSIKVVQDAIAKMGISSIEAHPFPVARFIETVDRNLDFATQNNDTVEVVIHRIIEQQRSVTPVHTDILPWQTTAHANFRDSGTEGAEQAGSKICDPDRILQVGGRLFDRDPFKWSFDRRRFGDRFVYLFLIVVLVCGHIVSFELARLSQLVAVSGCYRILLGSGVFIQ
jgi:hypothetical protein